MRPWFSVRSAADVAEFVIFDAIGKSFFNDDAVSARAFVDDLSAIPSAVTDITVRVNSLGGDVFDAVAIANALRDQHRSKGRRVTAVVEGIAASAASIVLMGAETIRVADNGLVMIHDPFTVALGNAAELRKTADALDTIRDASIVPSYQWHSSLSAKEIRALLAAETWMDADEAIAQGFATEKVQGLKAAASLDAKALATLHVPDKYRAHVNALVTPAPAPPANTAADPREVLRLCREGGCLDLAESLVESGHAITQVRAAITTERDRRTAAESRATEIRAICRTAKLDALADGYVRGGMSASDVRAHLTTITAAIDHIEIDSALPPDQGTPRKPRIDVTAIYAARNRLLTKG